VPAPPARSSASYTTENIVAADVSPTEDFEAFRPLLFGVAYRMLGSASDAEDAVQETWLRWHGATGIEAPQAWLIRVVTNICLDQLRSARVRREEYVGPWLPEPVLTGESVDDPLAAVQRRELLSLGALRVLERLSPRERAALVLHEGLGLSHAEVATALGATEAASRQLLARARRRLPADLRAPGGRRADPTEHRRLTEAMVAAFDSGDLTPLLALLHEDIQLVSDGGGQVRAALRPIQGAGKVLRFLAGLREREGARLAMSAVEVNGLPGLLVTEAGVPVAVVTQQLSTGRATELLFVVAPGKLAAVRRQRGL